MNLSPIQPVQCLAIYHSNFRSAARQHLILIPRFENTRCDYLLELENEEPKASTKSNRDFSNAPQFNLEYHRGAACKQHDLLRCELSLEVANN